MRSDAWTASPSPLPSGIIPLLSQADSIIMEAERINAIANHMADLAQRGTELRRYL